MKVGRLIIGLFASVLLSSVFFSLSNNLSGIHAMAASESPQPFSDLPSNPLYKTFLETFQRENIIVGYTQGGQPTGKLGPSDLLKRSEFTKVAALVRLMETKNDPGQYSGIGLDEFTLKTDTLLRYYYKAQPGAPHFTDVPDKDVNCAQSAGGCEPWFTQYVNYAASQGMIKGYKAGDGSDYFEPNGSMLRIHALKLVIASDGSLPADQDPKVIRITNDPRLEGRAVRCLVGTEDYILANNGGKNHDALNLLAYVMQADRLDIFGNRCQAFTEAGAYTPKQRANFLQLPIRRQEIARYFALTTTYTPLMADLTNDSTTDTKEEYILPVNAEWASEEIARLNDPMADPESLKNPAEEPEIIYLNRPTSDMSVAELAALSKTGRCCRSKDLYPEGNCKTITYRSYSISEEDDYNWITYDGPAWHLATNSWDQCWVPYPDLLSGYVPPEPKSTVKIASATITEATSKKIKIVTYPDPMCNVIMSCEPIITYETVYETKVVPGICGVNMSCEPKGGEVKDPKKVLANPKCGVTMSCNPVVQKPASNDEKVSKPACHDKYCSQLSAQPQSTPLDVIRNYGLKLYYDPFGTASQLKGDFDDKVLQSAWQMEGALYSVGNTVSEGWDAVTHPVDTVTGIYDALTHPVETGQALWNYGDRTVKNITTSCGTYDKECNVEQGRSGGEVGQMFIPAGAGLKAVKWGLKAAKIKAGLNIVLKYESVMAKTKKIITQPSNDVTKLTEEFAKRKIPFDKGLLEVAEKSGGTAELTTIKTASEKGLKRVERKGAPETVKDYLRGAITYDSVDDIYASLKDIEKKFDVADVKDSIRTKKYSSGYRDIKVIVRDKDGFYSEIQLMPKEIFEAKKIETPINNIRGEFEDLEKHAPNLADIKAAKEELRLESPDIYNEIERDIDAIIEHVENGKGGVPTTAIKGLDEASRSIFEPAWESVKQ